MPNSHPVRIAVVSGILLALWTINIDAAPSPVTKAEKGKSAVNRIAVSEDSSRWRRDPFAGGSDTKKVKADASGRQSGFKATKLQVIPIQSPDLNLQGIMQADKAFHALINGRVVKAGDKLEGVTVKEISRYQVVVQNEKKENIIYDIYQGKIDRGKQ